MQRAATHNDFALREQPIGRGVVAALLSRPIEPGHAPASIGHLPDIKLGAIQHQLFQFQAQHRAHADRDHDLGQSQGGAAFGVEQFDVAQLKRGDPAR